MFPIGNLIAYSTSESGRCGRRRRRPSGKARRRRRQKSIAGSLTNCHVSAASQTGGWNGQSWTASAISTDTRMIVSTSNMLQDRFPVMIPVWKVIQLFFCYRQRRKLAANHRLHNQSPVSQFHQLNWLIACLSPKDGTETERRENTLMTLCQLDPLPQRPHEKLSRLVCLAMWANTIRLSLCLTSRRNNFLIDLTLKSIAFF